MLIDCRHFTGSTPCDFHKLDGRCCDRCAEYERTTIRILIVKLAAAGDVLRTTCILPALRAAWPGCQITWITEGHAVPLLEGNPLIDRIISRDAAVARLLVERFDIVFGLDPDADGGSLTALARCGERRGFVLDDRGLVAPANQAAELWWRLGLDDGLKRANRRTYPDILHEVCGLTDTGARPQIFVPAAARAAVRERLACRLAAFDRTVLVNTGGGDRFRLKRWTYAHYLEFMRAIRRAEPDTALLLAGGPAQAHENARLLAEVGSDAGIVDAGCGNTIKEFAAVVELSDLVVTSDSLALHLATALSRPVVAFVGPTSPWELELYGLGQIVSGDVPCLACYRRECDRPTTCMDVLEPETVYRACAAALSLNQ